MSDLLTIPQRTSFPPRVQKIKIQKKKTNFSFSKINAANKWYHGFSINNLQVQTIVRYKSTTFWFYLYGKARALLSSQFLAFLTTEVQHCTQSLGSRIMHPGLMVSYIEGKRMIIIYCYALKQRNQSVDVTYISTDRCLWTVRTKI